MGRYQGYEKYKDSGVEWLGEIPEHWEVKRLGLITEVINDINHEMPIAVDSGIPFLSAKDLLDDGNLNFEKDIKQISEEDFIRLSKKVCPKRNDIIYSRIGACLGKARIVENDIKFLISYSCCVIRLRLELANPLFFKYSLDSELILTEAKFRTQGIGVPDLGLKQIARFALSVPPLDEQESIACFLDRKTTQIDALIAKKAALLEKLDEKRTALISHSVTKGLDSSVLMKDSGVEWLGDIPKHWKKIPFRWCCRITEGQVNPIQSKFANLPLIAPNHIESNTGRLIYKESAEEQGAISGKYLYRAGTLLYSKIRPALVKACIADEDGLCSADMYPILVNKNLLTNKFMLYQIISKAFTQVAILASDRVAMPKINRETLGGFSIVIPPVLEQEKIVNHLDMQIENIDRQKAKVKEAIELLKEYRTALITNAVTGKIDVRQVARV